MLRAPHVTFASPRSIHAVSAAAPAPKVEGATRVVHGDAALVARALDGDHAAEAELYRRYAPSVHRLALRLLRSREEALDVLQDTFVRGFAKLGSLRDSTQFRGWIHAVAARLVHRRFRRERFLRAIGLGRRTTDRRTVDDVADDGPSAEARAELRWLDRALQKIDHDAATAWMLRYVEGLQLEEIADACECSLATVKRRVGVAERAIDRHFERADALNRGSSA